MKTETAIINQLINGEAVTAMDVPTITTQEQALEFIAAVGKAAREIAADKEDSFFISVAMREIENCYRSAKRGCYGHTDGGFGLYKASAAAFGWLAKMHTYATTGVVRM